MVYNWRLIKMRKILILMGTVFVLLIASSSSIIDDTFSGIESGNTLYLVTVSITVTHIYYDIDSGNEAFRNSSTDAKSMQVCASSPEQAKSEAKSECSSICSRSSGRSLGKKYVNGKYYNVYEYREVYDASAKVQGTC